jgi:hypothetical protein
MQRCSVLWQQHFRKTSERRLRSTGHYDASFVAPDNWVRKEAVFMKDEAEITINGTKLTDSESMTIRVAVDTLANVLAEDVATEGDQSVADRYMAALTNIQALLDIRQTRKQ